MLTDFGVKSKPTTEKNPTENAICEGMHHTVGDILRAIKAKIAEEDEAEQAVDNALYTCMHACTQMCSESYNADISWSISLP